MNKILKNNSFGKNLKLISLFMKEKVGGLALVLIFLVAFFGIFNPRFFSIPNLIVVGRQSSFLVIIAFGQMFPILTGGIDLSVGSNVGLASVICAAATLSFGIGWGILAGIISGTIIGCINGTIISKFKVAAFIVTLGMLSIIRGFVLTITAGQPVFGLSNTFRFLGTGNIFQIPVPSLIAIGVVFFSYIILNKTRFGRYVYAIGGNKEAARLSGINVKAVEVLVYCYCGMIAGLYSVIMSSRVNSGQPNLGSGLELVAIGAVVIGGTSLYGGKGNVKGVLIGAIIMGIISNGLNLMRVSSFIQMMVNGLIIILAVIISQSRKLP